MKWFEENSLLDWVISGRCSAKLIRTNLVDLGLDVHVKSAYVETDDGYVLDWGYDKAIQTHPTLNRPRNRFLQILPPIVSLILLILVFLLLSRHNNNIPIIGIILLHPTLIFSSGGNRAMS